MPWDNIEDAFKELDTEEFSFFASALSSYHRSLMKNGFTRREAFRLTEGYSKFIYDMCIEEFLRNKRDQEDLDEEDTVYPPEDEDVDSFNDDDVE